MKVCEQIQKESMERKKRGLRSETWGKGFYNVESSGKWGNFQKREK